MASLDTLIALLHRRGFVYQSSEIYGGLASSYDYAHYGYLLKENIKDAWRRAMLQRGDVVMQDAAIIMHPATWEASGHLERFFDPLVSCLECKARYRQDHLEDADACPRCGGDLSDPVPFSQMLSTQFGASDESASTVYLRPETAQGIFVNFLNTIQTQRVKVPFGVAQLGKSFRNEITTRQFILRTREFEQAEMEYFVHPDHSMDAFAEWQEERLRWWLSLGIAEDRLRLREHGDDERSHYSDATTDIEYRFDHGWVEAEGVAHRSDFDLKAHAKHSGAKLQYRDPTTGEVYVPHVIEPAMGVNRAFLMVVDNAYDEEEMDNGKRRTVLRLHPRLAPVTAAVFPLKQNDPEMVARSNALTARLRAEDFRVEHDPVGNIGKAYLRQDEIGTPWCVTVDHRTLEDDTVTIRDRDTRQQERLPVDGVAAWIAERLRA